MKARDKKIFFSSLKHFEYTSLKNVDFAKLFYKHYLTKVVSDKVNSFFLTVFFAAKNFKLISALILDFGNTKKGLVLGLRMLSVD